MKKILLSAFTWTAFTAFSQHPAEKPDFGLEVGDTVRFQIRQASESSYSKRIDLKKGQGYHFKVEGGTMNYGYQSVYDFRFLNYTDTPLIVLYARWAEPNFSPDRSNCMDPITQKKPGTLRYKGLPVKRPGKYSRIASFSTNFGDFTVNFMGNMLPQAIFLDKSFTIQEPGADNSIHSEFSIRNKGETDLKIDSIQVDQNTSVSYGNQDMKIIPPGGQQIVQFTHKPAKEGNSTARITLYVDGTLVEHYIYVLAKEPKKKQKTE